MTPATDKKLFLLDAYALIYRAYFAFANNPRVNSKGMNTSAIFGFANTLLEVLKKEKPSHIAVVFDLSGPTVRHDEFVEYKAHREEMPEDLRTCIPYIYKLIEAFNIPTLSKEGYEADDVIGTLAKIAETRGYTTYMMTPDKDYGQLVDKNTFIYKPARLGNGVEILGPDEICKKWEIKHVGQLIDILGLMGDKVDNIPGIPGVGEKTAIQLVKDYDTIEKLYEDTSKLKGKLKEKVENNKEQALLSKKLATIIIDVPIEFNEEALAHKEYNKEALKEIFTELEFRRMAEQVLGETIQEPVKETISNVAPAKIKNGQTDLFASDDVVTAEDDEPVEEQIVYKTIKDVAHEYVLVDTAEKRKALLDELNSHKEFCFDSETTSLDVFEAEVVGLSFAVKAHKAYYVNVPANQQEAQQVMNEFKALLEDENKTLIGQNIKYDLQVIRKYGIEIKNKLFDTMVTHFLINENMRHNMNVLSETYLGYSPVSIEDLIGKKGKEQTSMRDVSLDIITDYAAEDADVTLQLKNVFEPMIEGNGTKKLLHEVELPLIKVLSDMENEGVRIDASVLQNYSIELEKEIADMDKEIQGLAGTAFNIASPKQVGEILFEYLKIVDKPKKTKTGQYSTGEDVLSKLMDKHPIVPKILEYREIVKLKNTYVDTLPLLINKKTNRVHTSYNQVVAVTGRLSSDNPNLQNIPIRTEKGRAIRKAFIPRDENHIILSADYSQIELRIMAEMSKDAGMMEAFINGLDIHTATAAKVYGVDLDGVTSDMRRNAKMVNFGIIYGISAFGLSERLNIPRREAAEIIENYWKQYGGVKQYMQDCVEIAQEKGYVETLMGRRRYLRDINSANAVVRGFAERNAINAPIQGSAAEMIKVAMINIKNEFDKQNFKSKMILQVHDELVFDVYKPELETVKPIIENLMKNAIPLTVPMEVGIGVGVNWLEAH